MNPAPGDLPKSLSTLNRPSSPGRSFIVRFITGASCAVLLALCAAASAAAAPIAEQPDKFAWLEGQHDPAAVAWATERTNQALAELRAKPMAAAVEQELRDALKSNAPPAHYELLGERVGRFMRDESHPLGLLQTAPRGADGGVGGPWRTVLDVGALDKKEGKNYQLMGMDFRSLCLPPAFERCLVPLSPGASESREYRELDLARGAFVEGGFRVPRNRSIMVWLDANTLLIAVPDNLDGKSVLRSNLPGVVRLWKRGTPFAQSKVIFQASPDDSVVEVSALAWARSAKAL
jgi:prolyl oligopeptidase